MAVEASQVKELREKTGAGILDCQKALLQAGGDMAKAVEWLRAKGLSIAQKKAGRATQEGLIGSYIHPGGQLGVLVEVNCETDFVAKTEEFSELVKDLAMQVAATGPSYVRREDVPVSVLEGEKAIYLAQAKETGKPPPVADKIAAGRLEKFLNEVCLLEQPFVKDPSITVQELIHRKIAKLGENITVRRFARYRMGEE